MSRQSELHGLRVAIVTPTTRFYGGVEQVNDMTVALLERQGMVAEVVSRESLGEIGTRPRWRRLLRPDHRLVATYFNRHVAQRSDVVICNGEYAFGVRHAAAIVSFHGCYYGYAKALKPFLPRRSYWSMMRLARHQRRGAVGKFVVADSVVLARVLTRQGIATDAVIENAVDDVFFDQSRVPKIDRCLVVGTYDHYGKGFDVLGDLAGLGVGIDCISVQRPADGRLRWLGARRHGDLPPILAEYRFLVFPSRFEGSGLVAAEAMAVGTPVIMSNVGLGTTLKEEIPEFVVDGPHEGMAGAIVRQMRRIESAYDDYARRARDYARAHHGLSTWEARWLDAIRKVGPRR